LLPEVWAKEKAPREGQVKATARAARFGFGRRRGELAMQSVALEGQRDRVLSNARCPGCGSSEFTQYKPGEAPPEG
jgi:hypothetical protein